MIDLCLRSLRAALFAGAAAVILIIPLPPHSAAAETDPLSQTSPSVQRRTLPSGLTVIVAAKPKSALAAIDLRVRVGSGSETAATSGTAHFIEHLVFKGTETGKLGEIDQAIEAMGGELTAQTSRDTTRFATVLPAAKWEGALAIIADMTLHPAFREGDVAAEKKVILNEMAIARANPTRAGFNALTETVFDPKDPYRLPLMGTEARVRAMTSEALRHFWQQWYRPENMVLVVAGNVTAPEVFATAERLFPAVPSEEKAPAAEKTISSANTEDAARNVRSVITDTSAADLTTIFFGFPAPSAGDLDAAAAVAGFVSLLAERADQGGGYGILADALAKKQPLAVSVTADYVSQRGKSLVMITASGQRRDAEKLEKALRETLRRLLLRGFTEEDAAQARQNLRDAQESDGTMEGMASRLALAEILHLPDSEMDAAAPYTARLERAVTPSMLTVAARRYLAPDLASVVVINPPALVPAPVTTEP